MDMVEVCDRQLFVTCRLCISDLGVYQISPQVQQQIKYCFDIDVELFDGLPQLVCKKCKTILQEHYHVKQSFLEKQATLKTKLANKNMKASNEEHNDNNSQEELPSSSARVEDIEPTGANYHVKQTFVEKPATLETVKNVGASSEVHNENKSRQESPCLSAQDEDDSIKPTRPKRKRCRLPSSTSSENLESHEVEDTDPFEISKKRYKPLKCSTWKDNYKRKFICQVCSKMCKKKNSLTKHLRKHNTLLTNFPTVFSRGCKVKLIKIDNNPNMTGSNDNVVVSPNRILSNCKENNNYCVIYTSKRNRTGRLNSSDGCENNQDVNGDSSDEDIIGKKDYERRSRTRSSNETVILNDDNADARENSNRVMSDEDENVPLNDAECINIDDSSDGESTKSNRASRDSADITPVRAKWTDHKSIQNIVSGCCTKYLKRTECAENEMSKGLDESKLKRIILNMGQKIVSKQGFNCTGLLRFMEYSDLKIKWIQANPKYPKNIGKESNYVYIQPKLIDKLNSKADGWIDIPEQHVLPVNHYFETEGSSDGHKVCSKNSTYSAVQTDKAQSKLLNKSPVANPKQLPKKTYINPSSENTDPEPVFDTEKVNGDNLCMPIITSTKSLAFPATEVQKTVSGIENSAVLNNKDVNESIDTSVVSNSKTVNESIENSVVSDNKNVNEYIENSAVLNNKDVNESIENSAVSNNKNVNESVKISAVSNNKNVKETIENSAGLNNKNVKESVENSTMSNIKNVKESEKNLPRIKVKPASELMSDRVLKNLSQMQQVNTANVWDTPQPSNIQSVAVSNIPIHVPNGKNTSPVQALQLVPYQKAGGSAGTTASATATAAEDKDYLVLDTVELPNYRTNSPFKYVQKLLQMHNLVLLESHESVTRDFVCLIKFKLQFKQDTIDDPVILFLSFHCLKYKFYLGVKASNQENNIDLSKLSANWQWEIINKIYREEVVSKVLKNAQKICQSTHDYAKSFLCLLKSVKKRET